MYIVIHKPAVCKDMRENSFKTYFKNFNYVHVFGGILGVYKIKIYREIGQYVTFSLKM